MAQPDEHSSESVASRLLKAGRVASIVVAIVAAGAFLGLVVAIRTPAHVEIAGSDTRLWLAFGRTYDELSVGGVIAGKRDATRTILGEPVGVRAVVDLNPDGLVDQSGQFNVDILPAYVQAYSDPEQVVEDARRAVIGHVVWRTGGGAAFALAAIGFVIGYRRWRAAYDRRHFPDSRTRASARDYHEVERTLARRSILGVTLGLVLATVPSASGHVSVPTALHGDPVFAGTSLAGTEIDGLLQPAIVAIQTYIETYFEENNKYYNRLRTALVTQLDTSQVRLPGADDPNVAQFGFVTDRHCNIGMDRVIVTLLSHYGVSTLVSAGDDAFSGSFGFESACTRNLADKTRQAGITDVFAGGNHDSPMTIDAQAQQRIKSLTGRAVSVDGLTFIGSPDPRTSRYGQGIVPASSSAQTALVEAQGAAVGKTACKGAGPVVAVLHDPAAGRTAMQNGCGRITLALDGHVHRQEGPTLLPLPNGTDGYQFVGASSGGAPSPHTVDTSLAARVTVGPLNHDATVDIVSVDRTTGTLVGVTEYTFTPLQLITVAQQTIP
jgi:hypothetical protein